MSQLLANAVAQFWRILPVLVVVYVPVALILGGLFLVWVFGGDISQLTRDPLAVVETELLKIQRNPDAGIHDLAALDLPFYIGTVSNIGVLLWCATAAICFFTAALSRRRVGAVPSGLFLTAGAISAIFMLDDLFLLHERALPIYFDTSEVWLFGIYAILIAVMLIVYRNAILKSDYLILGMAFGFFGISLAIDLLPVTIPQTHFFEDGAKLAGIVAWATYHMRNAADMLRPLPTE